MLVMEIAQFLSDNKLGKFDETGVSGNIFVMSIPATPDTIISIYPSGGTSGDFKLAYDRPRIQIIVRGTKDPRVGYELANKIYDKLHGMYNCTFVPNGTHIVLCEGVQTPIHIGKDSNGRHEFSLNFDLEVLNQTENREY
jgi:hypothetical protein